MNPCGPNQTTVYVEDQYGQLYPQCVSMSALDTGTSGRLTVGLGGNNLLLVVGILAAGYFIMTR